MPDAYDIKILATDIDPNMVTEGQEAVYPDAAMESVPSASRSKWFVNGRSPDPPVPARTCARSCPSENSI